MIYLIKMSSTIPLMKLKVAELRAQLESRSLDSKGTKPTLVARLQEAMDKDEETDAMTKVVEKSEEEVLGTPRKTRRLSGSMAVERPETPTRKSRRLSETVAEDNSRPATPTRKSRRLSGGVDPVEERPLTPSRKSRRLSGAGLGEEEKQESVKNILLEDQLASLGSPRRTSVTARNKRISQLGGAAITTIPEVPEKEEKIEAPIVEENENNVEDEELPEKADKVALSELCTEAKSITDVVESAFTAIKDEANSLVVALKENQTKDSAEKENLPMVAVLDAVIVSKQIPRQKPKSGKFWKEGRQQFRQIKKDKGRKFTFEQRMKNKEEKLKNKELADLLLSRKAEKREEMRKKIEDNKARKLENEKKSEQFQVIKNPAKIKRMKKKQLRMLEKRDLVTV